MIVRRESRSSSTKFREDTADMKLRIALLFVFFAVGLPNASGTPQIPDILLYEGKEYPIHNELLSTYFSKYPERKPKSDWVCSALWRGYVATFEIVEGSVFLKHVTTGNCDTPNPAMSIVAPKGERVKIDWYSGLLLSSYGRNDEDPYSLSSLDAYEKYSIFEIDAGNFRRVKHFDNKQYHDFRKRQFKAFKKTGEYREVVNKMTADGRLSVSDADSNIMLWLVSYTKKFLVD